ncbi:MAG: glycoside hydrolase family 3 protein [Spirochaetota bacterium]
MVSGRRRATPILILLSFIALTGCVTDRDPEAAGLPNGYPGSLTDLPRLSPLPEPGPTYPDLVHDPGDRRRTAAPVSRVPRPETDPGIEELLDSLTLRQRIGQRFIAPVNGHFVSQGAAFEILEVSPAGFIIYPWNFETAAGIRRLTGQLQLVASHATPQIRLLLCTDQEGGRVETFRFPGFVRFPPAASIGAFEDPSLVRAAAYITGRQLERLGINMNLAPVLDLRNGTSESIIGDRSYGPDPRVVSDLVEAYVETMRSAGIVATAKHFPGHGVTTVDSHSALPVVSTSRSRLSRQDLAPFVRAIETGVPVVMTGHILFDRIDPFYPATLSRVFLHDILRHELGFEGVVMTDGLEMRALRDNYSLPETLVRLFKYDVDLILLYSSYDVVELVTMVEDLIATGEITEDDVNRGVRRVLALKRDYGLIQGGLP